MTGQRSTSVLPAPDRIIDPGLPHRQRILVLLAPHALLTPAGADTVPRPRLRSPLRSALAMLLKGSIPVAISGFLLYGLDRAAIPSRDRHPYALEDLAQALAQKAAPYVHAG
ncbi:hypothetical protein [Streptomyces violascens]|uniref:hypothetical protein n=1 Tax=Streptomyces violascens TaxID=67381 RepID=UPI0036674990